MSSLRKSFFPGDLKSARFAIPPACYRSLSGPSGPKCPQSPQSARVCPRRGVPAGLRSVQKVSRECRKGAPDTPGTLSGHFWTARGPLGPGHTPSDTPSDTPHFRGHSQGHSGDTSGPKGPRDSCRRPAGSERKIHPEIRRITLRDLF